MGRQANPPIPPLAVVAAPLSGISDAPFRAIARRWGADLVVSEMIASRAVLDESRMSRRERRKMPVEEGAAVQLAGCDPAIMAEAARVAAGEGAPAIDINFGCPAKKVVNQAAGSAIMADEDLAQRILNAVAAAVSVPVSVKMRLGWRQDRKNASSIALLAQAAGLSAITVHGRTRDQGFKGQADWQAVSTVRPECTLPLLVNGDIQTAEDAVTARAAASAEGVMIGRGACGQPWLFREAKAALKGEALPPRPSFEERAETACAHYEAILSHYGERQGLRVGRKHVGWYLDHLPGGAAWRARLLPNEDAKAVLSGLWQAHVEADLLAEAA